MTADNNLSGWERMLPRDYPPLDPRLMGHEELTPWLLPHSGDRPLVPYKDRGPIHPSILAQMAHRWAGVQRRWYLRLPPGYLVLDADSKIAEEIISALIEAGRLPDTHWQVKTRRGKHRWYRIDYPQGKRQLIGGLDIITNWRGNQGVVAPDGYERKTLPGFGEGEPPYLPLPELVNLIEEFQKGTGQIPQTRRDPGWTGEGRSLEWHDRSGPYANRATGSDLALTEICFGKHGRGCKGGRNHKLMRAGRTWGFRQTRKRGWVVPDLEEFVKVMVGHARAHFCKEHWGEYLETGHRAGPELLRVAEAVRDFVMANASEDGFLASQRRLLTLARTCRKAKSVARRAQAWLSRSMGDCVKEVANSLGVSPRTVSRLAPQRGPRTEAVHRALSRESTATPLPPPRSAWGCRHS